MMEAQSGYDAGRLFSFEREKLAKVQGLLTDSFNKVQGIMQKYNDEKYKEVISEFGQQFGAFRQAVTQVLTQPLPQGLRDPFQDLQALQIERQQGYDKLNELNDEIQRLRDQNAAQNRLIEELQSSSSKNNNNNNNSNRVPDQQNGNNDDPPYSEPLHFDDPQSEIQGLNSVIEQLRIENGSLKEETRMLSAKMEDLQRKVKVGGGQVRSLFRNDTVTNWNPDDLDSLKQELNKQKLALMTSAQMNFASGKEPEPNMGSINEQGTNEYGMNGQASQKHLYRNDTKADWDKSELDQLKEELMSQLKDQQREALSAQFDKQMRYPEERRPTNLVQGAEDLGVLTEDEIRAKHDAITQAMLQAKQDAIMRQSEKGMALREAQENQGMLQLDELDEARQRLMQMQAANAKMELAKRFEKQDQMLAPIAEPTNEQYEQLDGFLKNVLGLLNENIRERTINELKAVFTEKSSGNNGTNGRNDATRESHPHSEMGTPYVQSVTAGGVTVGATGGGGVNVNRVSNSLLDDEENDAEILYPTPGGVTAGGFTDDGTTPGGPTPGGPMETNQIAQESEWQEIAEDQTKKISLLQEELNQKTDLINQLNHDISLLQKEISSLRKNNNNSNNNNISNRNESNYNGDGRNISQTEINELKKQIRDLKDMKFQLIDSTSKEINHLRNLIRDMQKHINGEL